MQLQKCAKKSIVLQIKKTDSYKPPHCSESLISNHTSKNCIQFFKKLSENLIELMTGQGP